MYSRVVHTFSIEGRHIFGMCLTLKTQKSFLQMGSEHGLTFSSMRHSQNTSDLSTLNIAWSIYQFVALKVCFACCFLFKNIAKGTTYLRVEFCLPKFKQVQTQILIKFHLQLQNLKQTSASWLNLKFKILTKASFRISTKIQLHNLHKTSASKILTTV